MGDAMQFVIAAMRIHPYQDVRILSTATGGSTLSFASSVPVAAAAQLTVTGGITLSNIEILFSAAHIHNLGQVTLANGVTVSLPDGTTPAVSGTLPGTVTAGTVTVSRATAADQGTWTWSAGNPWTAEWDGGSTVNNNGNTFALYLLPAQTFTHDGAGAALYQSLCEGAGLRTLGSGYDPSYCCNCAPYNCLCTPDSPRVT